MVEGKYLHLFIPENNSKAWVVYCTPNFKKYKRPCVNKCLCIGVKVNLLPRAVKLYKRSFINLQYSSMDSTESEIWSINFEIWLRKEIVQRIHMELTMSFDNYYKNTNFDQKLYHVIWIIFRINDNILKWVIISQS